jgi:hypothetical protein
MIIGVYKPIKENKEITSYRILIIDDLYNKGSQRYKVTYKCDGINCKTPDKIYAITREHLSEKRSKTVNDKIQICRSCQTTGSNNPRYCDNRSWEEILGKERSDKNKENYRNRFINNNPSKDVSVKKKKNQIVINFDNVNKYVSSIGFTLCNIEGDNKFAKLSLICKNNHRFEIQWASFRSQKNTCRSCYYESIRIPFEEIEIFETYSKTVRSLTRYTFSKNKKIIDPNGLKELDSKRYHIDHIYSISDGYLNDIDPKIIASVANLRVIDSLENLKKGKRSDITLESLLKSQ